MTRRRNPPSVSTSSTSYSSPPSMASKSSADADMDTTNKTTTSVDTTPQSSAGQTRDTESVRKQGLTLGTVCVITGGLLMMWIVSDSSFPQPAFDSVQWYALLAFVIIYWAVTVRWIRTQNFRITTDD